MRYNVIHIYEFVPVLYRSWNLLTGAYVLTEASAGYSALSDANGVVNPPVKFFRLYPYIVQYVRNFHRFGLR